MAIEQRPDATLANVMVESDVVTHSAARKALGALRIAFGFTFLWAFIDKTFALGFHTGVIVNDAGEKTGTDVMGKGAAWLNGGSPTKGFLSGVSTSNPFHGIYTSMAGATWVNWLFMLGLLGIGVALLFGFAIRIASVSGALMYTLMYLAAIPWISGDATNPVIDDHIIGLLAMIVFGLTLAGDTWGVGKAWAKTSLVRRNAWLR
jgi:thiosulfate dehydrogenase [quinone] large subunit